MTHTLRLPDKEIRGVELQTNLAYISAENILEVFLSKNTLQFGIISYKGSFGTGLVVYRVSDIHQAELQTRSDRSHARTHARGSNVKSSIRIRYRFVTRVSHVPIKLSIHQTGGFTFAQRKSLKRPTRSRKAVRFPARAGCS